MNLPHEIEAAVAPIFLDLPLDRAMPDLVLQRPIAKEHSDLIQELIHTPALLHRPVIQIALWLYVYELDHSHSISQGLHDRTGSMWHAIMHRRRGDFGNSRYWLNRAKKHPALQRLQGYDSYTFLEDVTSHYRYNPKGLVEMQRLEWASLFKWSANGGQL